MTHSLLSSRSIVNRTCVWAEQPSGSDDGYLADRWVPRKALGFGVEVYPVIVLWGDFDLEPHWIGDVFLLHGQSVADWIQSRPADLLKPEKRQAVAEYVRSMERA